MDIKIQPSNSTNPSQPNKQGKLKILIDCAIPIKEGSTQYINFKEGDIVEFYKLHKKKVKACCGAPGGFKYSYVIKYSNVLLPVVFGREL